MIPFPDPPLPTPPLEDVAKVFPGGGELGALMRAKDWSDTPLGPVSGWPQSLRTSLGFMLSSPPASFIFWGPELSMLYNDGGRPILGAKHPEDLGQSMRVVFKEAWSVLGPMVESVIATGTAIHLENLLVPLRRFGFIQDGYFTFSYLPIRDEAARIGGMLAIAMETTVQVVGARRLALIQELSIRAARCQDVASALRSAEEVLHQAPNEVPFALLYELRGERGHLVACAGIERGLAASPAELDLREGSAWPLAEVARSRREALLEDLAARFGALPGGPSGEPATRALLLPLAAEGEGEATFVLVVGLNPRIPLDDDARSFVQLLARQLATSIASTRALEEKTLRAAQLAELNHQKTQFFSNVSHEFRTPLTLILGPTEDALASPTRALAGEQLERVHGNAQRLLKLVNTLLEFARVEAGKSRATFQPTDIAALTAGLANAFESVVSKAGLEFVVDCPPLPEPIWVDHSLWEKVVLNLVSNAFKFTLAGQIKVRLSWTGQGVELTVADTGIGIAPHELPKVFQRFHRVEGAEGRSHEGSGIGLSLVEALVKLHGGDVSVRSVLGAGSTFTVTLPAGNAHLPANDLQPEERSVAPPPGTSAFVREAAQWLPALEGAAARGHDKPAAGLNSTPPITPAPGPRVRVLLADDNVDMRGYVQRVLADHFLVEAVADGQAALDAARERLPDLVLSDVMMPVMDGLALTRALRAEPQTRHVPIILLSARVGEGATVEGLQAGADDYIVKPFGARELVARIEGAVRFARAELARRQVLERLSEVLEATSDGFFVLDSAWRITGANASYERISHTRREDVIGQVLWDVFPALRDPSTRYWQAYHRCMTERTDVQFVDYYAPIELWADVRANPTPDGGIAVWFRDVTTEQRSKALLERQAEFEKQLIGIVSHDLRNPLNAILLATELLSEMNEMSGDAARIVARIHGAADGATRLVRDLLDFTQARLGGGIHVAPRPADWHALVHRVLEDGEALFPSHRFEVRHEGDGQGEWDPDRLTQVVQNLVTNALKYSPAGSPVRVHTQVERDEAILLVNNGGAAIPPEKLPVLFEPLQRATAQVDSASRSVGLGLYIVKHIVEAHHGTVEVQSTEAEGTTFTVRVPRRATLQI
jgi:PAS domain S-box-containing protein